jgi:PKD repeat protein
MPGSKTDSFTVTGSHTYAMEGTSTITVIINHEGQKTTVTTTATVKDKLGLLLLDPTGSKSLMVTGNGNVAVTGTCGALVVDWSADDAVFATGNAVVSAGDFDVTGGVATHGHPVLPSPVDHEAPTPDPLGLGLPSPLPPPPVGNTATVLHPGTYVGGLHFSGKDAVTLTAGVYVMESGGFRVDGQASVSGSGVVIVNTPSEHDDTISVSGKGAVSLSAPTSGPYKGVAVVQTSDASLGFSGQANVTIAGVFYVPNAPVSISGNAVITINPGASTASLPPIFAAMIAFDLHVSGNGSLIINADDPPSGGMAARSSSGAGGAAIQDLAIQALSGRSLTDPATLTDQAVMDAVAANLAANSDSLNWAIGLAKKKS